MLSQAWGDSVELFRFLTEIYCIVWQVFWQQVFFERYEVKGIFSVTETLDEMFQHAISFPINDSIDSLAGVWVFLSDILSSVFFYLLTQLLSVFVPHDLDNLCVWVCVYVYMCVCVCLFKCAWEHIHLSLLICSYLCAFFVCVCVCVPVCVRMYIYVCVHALLPCGSTAGRPAPPRQVGVRGRGAAPQTHLHQHPWRPPCATHRLCHL